MRRFLYRLWQWIWGFPQTLLGLFICVIYLRCPHFPYHGAIATEWNRETGLSLGMFLFVPRGREPWFLVHEYGHTIQSLILGPCYLLLVGIPSVIWGYHPHFRKQWYSGGRAYDSVYPENWATGLGKRVTGEKTVKW